MSHPVRTASGPARVARLGAALALGLSLTLSGVVPAHAAAPQEFDPADCEAFQPRSPGREENWAAERLQLERAHRLATGDGITVAVIDTGVDPRHLTFRDGQVTTLTFAPNEDQRAADCDHGTGVASLIGSQPNRDPDTSFVGVAPGVQILALRALPKGPPEDPSNADPGETQALEPTVEAIDYAVDRGVDIISISQQGSDTPEYRAAVERAVRADILVVAAAGNLGNSSRALYPAAYQGVMAVGMTTRQDIAPELSQHSPELTVSVAAPGFPVLMLRPSAAGGRSYRSASGTSFATPIVAGAAALVMEHFPKMSAAQVKRRLEVTADAPPAAVPDAQLGWGIVNPFRALTDPMVGEPSQAAVPAPPGGATPRSPYEREKPDHTNRNVAIAIAAGSIGAVLVAGVVAASLPAGRRRRWRPGDRG